MPAATPQRASEPPPATRCVVLRPATTPLPPDLSASLQRQGIHLIDCTDPFAATAHICRLEHRPPDGFILLLVSPAQVPDAANILDTAARYAPHAACWWYDASSEERLKRITVSDIAAWRSLHAPQAAPGPRAPSLADQREPASAAPIQPSRPGVVPRHTPTLRLIVDGDAAEPAPAGVRNGSRAGGRPQPAAQPLPADHADDPADHDEPAAPTPAALLTNEELAMLLSDPMTTGAEPLPEPPGPRGGGPRKPWWRRPGPEGIGGGGT